MQNVLDFPTLSALSQVDNDVAFSVTTYLDIRNAVKLFAFLAGQRYVHQDH